MTDEQESLERRYKIDPTACFSMPTSGFVVAGQSKAMPKIKLKIPTKIRLRQTETEEVTIPGEAWKYVLIEMARRGLNPSEFIGRCHPELPVLGFDEIKTSFWPALSHGLSIAEEQETVDLDFDASSRPKKSIEVVVEIDRIIRAKPHPIEIDEYTPDEEDW